MKISTFLQVLFAVLVAASCFLVLVWKPTYVDTLEYQGRTIQIYRDELNIPKIVAPDQLSAFYALGYVMAEDRLFQMEIKRILVRGRLAEFMGSKAVEIDKFMRDMRFHRLSVETDKLLKQQDPATYALFKSFSEGINNQVSHRMILPIEYYFIWHKFDSWAPVDTIGLSKLLEFSQSHDHKDEYLRSLLLKNYTKEYVDEILPYKPEYFLTEGSQVIVNDQELLQMGLFQKQKTTEHPKFTAEHLNKMLDIGMNSFSEWFQLGRGSNSWVVGGNLTESGRPLLANDPHLDNAMPSEWYQVRMNYTSAKKKPVSFQGVMMAGCFTGLVGQTEYWGWAITTQYADNADLYLEKVEGDKYFFEGEWRPLKIIEEDIKVRFGQSVKHRIRLTHRGPLISVVLFPARSYSVQEPISMAWVGSHSNTGFLKASSDFLEIENYEQLMNLLKFNVDMIPNCNFLYITRDNHFGYQSGGRIPIRRNIESSAYIKDGTVADDDWIGYVDGDEKLRLTDPAKGYIITANNRPSTGNFKSGVYESNNYMVTARHLRIQQLIDEQIASGKKFTVKDFQRMQMDTVDSYCLLILPDLMKLNKDIQKRLKSWDCDMSTKSVEAALYNVFLAELQKLLKPHHNLPFENYIPFAHYTFRYILNQTNAPTDLKAISQAWKNTYVFLEKFLKTKDQSQWEWGKIHGDSLPHRIFDKIPGLRKVFSRVIPGFGNENTVNVGRMGKSIDGDFNTYHRANLRMIQSYVAGESEFMIDTGSSESIFSNHYDDQLSYLIDGKYSSLYYEPPVRNQKAETSN